MALGHPIFGRPLVIRLAFGTEVPHLAPEDLAQFPVIRLGPTGESTIADLIEQASELRRGADEAENHRKGWEEILSSLDDLR